MSVQDVEALVDLYLSPKEVVTLLPIDPTRFVRDRAEALAGLPEGARFPQLEASLAQFGLTAELASLVTQSASSGALRTENSPQELRRAANRLSASNRMSGQVRKVLVRID